MNAIQAKRFLATIGWTGPGAEPWTEYLHGETASSVARYRQQELDAAHPDKAPHAVSCVSDGAAGIDDIPPDQFKDAIKHTAAQAHLVTSRYAQPRQFV